MIRIGEFAQWMADDINSRYEREGISIRLQTMEKEKNNGVVLNGLWTDIKGDGAVPVLYLENAFDRYQKGESFGDISKEIGDIYLELYENSRNVEVPDINKESVKDMLRLDLIDTLAVKEFNDSLITYPVSCGYAIAVYADPPKDSPIQGRIRITGEIAEKMGYDREELLEDAVRSATRFDPPVLSSVADLMMPAGLGEEQVNYLAQRKRKIPDKLLVLTTQSKYLGASALYYPQVQRRIGDLVGGDYYVIPSSVHEVLVVPEGRETAVSDLASALKEVNSSLVRKEEQLGNRILQYRRETGRLYVAMDLDMQQNRERGR